jgi:hypothetical protein
VWSARKEDWYREEGRSGALVPSDTLQGHWENSEIIHEARCKHGTATMWNGPTTHWSSALCVTFNVSTVLSLGRNFSSLVLKSVDRTVIRTLATQWATAHTRTLMPRTCLETDHVQASEGSLCLRMSFILRVDKSVNIEYRRQPKYLAQQFHTYNYASEFINT